MEDQSARAMALQVCQELASTELRVQEHWQELLRRPSGPIEALLKRLFGGSQSAELDTDNLATAFAAARLQLESFKSQHPHLMPPCFWADEEELAAVGAKEGMNARGFVSQVRQGLRDEEVNQRMQTILLGIQGTREQFESVAAKAH